MFHMERHSRIYYYYVKATFSMAVVYKNSQYH